MGQRAISNKSDIRGFHLPYSLFNCIVCLSDCEGRHDQESMDAIMGNGTFELA